MMYQTDEYSQNRGQTWRIVRFRWNDFEARWCDL